MATIEGIPLFNNNTRKYFLSDKMALAKMDHFCNIFCYGNMAIILSCDTSSDKSVCYMYITSYWYLWLRFYRETGEISTLLTTLQYHTQCSQQSLYDTIFL